MSTLPPSNAAFIARHLAAIGLDLLHKITAGDNRARSAEALEMAPERARVVISTGGVGLTWGRRDPAGGDPGDLEGPGLRFRVDGLVAGDWTLTRPEAATGGPVTEWLTAGPGGGQRVQDGVTAGEAGGDRLRLALTVEPGRAAPRSG